jgi:hypothetical protein
MCLPWVLMRGPPLEPQPSPQGNLLDAKRPAGAKLAAAVSTALGVGSMPLMGVIMLASRAQIG